MSELGEDRLDTQVRRTEEVQDIVDRMPLRGGYYVLSIVAGIVIVMLFFGFIIRYPQTVSGMVTITMSKAPVKLVAKNTGKLCLLDHQARQSVGENEIVALIDNPTCFRDYLLVDSLLRGFRLSENDSAFVNFPHNLNLGELNTTYYQFVNNYNEYCLYCRQNVYDLNEKNYRLELEASRYSLHHNREQLKLKEMQLEFYRREISRDSFCQVLGDYSERGVDRTRNSYLTVLGDWKVSCAEQKQILLKLEGLETQLMRLKVEKLNHENDLRMALRGSYHALQAAMERWKDTYAFIAPFDGRIEFLGFWRENDFIISGKELFAVVPEQNTVFGQLLLPSLGAGKVKTGQEVSIKLNDYPYMEYGSLEGLVHTISLVTNSKKETADQSDDLYLVLIELPDGLKTKFGSVLDFRYEVKGRADIKLEKRRLIERLFDNLKYYTN